MDIVLFFLRITYATTMANKIMIMITMIIVMIVDVSMSELKTYVSSFLKLF